MGTSVQSEAWGAVEGAAVQLFTMESAALRVQMTNFGARVTRVQVADCAGVRRDVVLGYDTLAEYVADTETYLGATVGRFANRIAGGTFVLDGERYHVPLTDAHNALHGGPEGFDRKVWDAEIVEGGVAFSRVSADGEMGFPGSLQVRATYTVEGGALRVEFVARSDKTTVVNLANHAYFNLEGEGSGTVLEHVVQVHADGFTPVDARQIPTGVVAAVAGTPFDFREPQTFGARMGEDDVQLREAGGYDHNFALRGGAAGLESALREVAAVRAPRSGCELRVLTTQPGLQVYAGNQLRGRFRGHGEAAHGVHGGFCMETQHFPDAPNQPAFASTELRPGDEFRAVTVYAFGVAG